MFENHQRISRRGERPSEAGEPVEYLKESNRKQNGGQLLKAIEDTLS
jgi:hypothetical protein